jgi:hypothetical protein
LIKQVFKKAHGLNYLAENPALSLKGGLRGLVIRQLRMLGIVGFPIPKYDTQTGTWPPGVRAGLFFDI